TSLFQNQALARAANTVSGAWAITARSARAGPRGMRLPCSQLRMVSTGTPSLEANSIWVSRARRRSSRTAGGVASTGGIAETGNSCPSRNSTIRPSAFSRKRRMPDLSAVDSRRSPLRSGERGLFQPEPQRRDAEEREEADHVGDRCDERAGGHRGI